MQKIPTFLTYNDQAEEAVNLYTSVFKNSQIGRVSRYGDTGPGQKGSVMSATFQIDKIDINGLKQAYEQQ